jgi:hypothetical protein
MGFSQRPHLCTQSPRISAGGTWSFSDPKVKLGKALGDMELTASACGQATTSSPRRVKFEPQQPPGPDSTLGQIPSGPALSPENLPEILLSWVWETRVQAGLGWAKRA